MCGIFGIVSNHPSQDKLFQGLKRLEYRGYDSSGMATIFENKIFYYKAKGNLSNLAKIIEKQPLPGNIGIGHTRWATHGEPNEVNAHPHTTERVAVIHNGIIENYQELRQEQRQRGVVFHSETDTEVIAHLLTQYLDEGHTAIQAISKTLKRLRGAYALAILISSEPDKIFAARDGAPMTIGIGDNEGFIGSDVYALSAFTGNITMLQDGDFATVSRANISIYDKDANPIHRESRQVAIDYSSIDKNGYPHFMLKEIYEQPKVMGITINEYIDPITNEIRLPHNDSIDFSTLKKITIIGCGTSYYAGMVAKYWMESMLGISVKVDIASEFRYGSPVFEPDGVVMFISQSGETKDTLAALELCKQHQQKTISIVNIIESSIAQASDMIIPTIAGIEVGVASTKAFTTQLLVLAILTLAIAQKKGVTQLLNGQKVDDLLQQIWDLPELADNLLNIEDKVKNLAESLYANTQNVIYIGRGVLYPIALEGALKLKELSYIHAEGIPAGELKHGTIALVDQDLPVIVVSSSTDPTFEKLASNVQEVAARKGKIVLFCDKTGCEYLKSVSSYIIELPAVSSFLSPILYTIPVQFLAYHIANLKGNDVDQPRNLAKSVTVE